MPEYYNYFHLTTATKSLNTAISYTGGQSAPCYNSMATNHASQEPSRPSLPDSLSTGEEDESLSFGPASSLSSVRSSKLQP